MIGKPNQHPIYYLSNAFSIMGSTWSLFFTLISFTFSCLSLFIPSFVSSSHIVGPSHLMPALNSLSMALISSSIFPGMSLFCQMWICSGGLMLLSLLFPSFTGLTIIEQLQLLAVVAYLDNYQENGLIYEVVAKVFPRFNVWLTTLQILVD